MAILLLIVYYVIRKSLYVQEFHHNIHGNFIAIIVYYVIRKSLYVQEFYHNTHAIAIMLLCTGTM